jgi:hypothetical protein
LRDRHSLSAGHLARLKPRHLDVIVRARELNCGTLASA